MHGTQWYCTSWHSNPADTCSLWEMWKVCMNIFPVCSFGYYKSSKNVKCMQVKHKRIQKHVRIKLLSIWKEHSPGSIETRLKWQIHFHPSIIGRHLTGCHTLMNTYYTHTNKKKTIKKMETKFDAITSCSQAFHKTALGHTLWRKTQTLNSLTEILDYDMK